MYIILHPIDKSQKQQEWEKFVFEKEKLREKIDKEMLGEMMEHHEDEDEYTFTIYHIKGKEDSEVKILEQPQPGYTYVIPHNSYLKYEP